MVERKINNIQGLRGVSILLIVLWHLNSIFPNNLPSTGDRGVEFFFLISGFLVANKYYDEKKLYSFNESFKYAIGKVKQIYIPYILSCIPWIIAEIIKCDTIDKGSTLLRKFIAYILVIQSFIPNQDYYWAFNGVMWFLSSLVFCYFITPVLFYIIRKINFLKSVLFFILIEISFEILCNMFFENDIAVYLTYIFPIFRMLDYGLGCTAYVLLKEKKIHVNEIVLFVFSAIYIFIMFVCGKKLSYSIYHIFEFILFYCVISSRGKYIDAILGRGLLFFLGNISMEVFVVHLPIIQCGTIIWKHLFNDRHRIIEWLILLCVSLVTAYYMKYVKINLKAR